LAKIGGMKTQRDNVISMGKGTPVVLLHSALSSKLQWYKLMRSMSNDYTMIALDLYGYGDSPLPGNKDPFTLSDEITWVLSLLEGLIPVDEPFHLVGHSYGGAVSLRFAYQSPGRVRSLTLFEPVAFHVLPEYEEALVPVCQMAELIHLRVKEGKYTEAAEHFIDYWGGAGTFSAFPKEFRKLLGESIKKLPLDNQALLDEPLSLEDYSKIKIPVCLMAGRQSPLESRRIAQLLADTLPDCRFDWIKGGHMAPLDQPDEVNTVIESFIRGIK
jgi:pimeloyl-ACP methyl ester carboxylesterase